MLIKHKNEEIIKVGVLVPQSPASPTASLNFVDGIKLYFTLFENRFLRGEVQLEIMDIGTGNSSKVLEKTQELMMNYKPNIILGYMNSMIGIELANMVNTHGIPVLISNLGEQAINQLHIPENLYFNTFQFWQSYFHLGKYLSEKSDKDWLIVSSLHDAGYDPLRAFRLGLQCNDANVVQEVYLNSDSDHDLIKEFNLKFEEMNNLFPALFFQPKLQHDLINYMSSRYDSLVTTPFYYGNDQTIKYWAFSDNTLVPDQKDIINGTMEYLNSDADLFHLLGYRAGAMLFEAVKNMDSPENDKINVKNTWARYNLKLNDEVLSIDTDYQDLNGLSGIYKGISNVKSNDRLHVIRSYDIDQYIMEEMTKDKALFTNPYMFF
ncbi:ABC transporter substrate-binding protein [Marivirga salinae]|uniref:ABC transporter substrate-binding protein n=1 Tax=Marivirga salinarum TaxID=3059078 RepID=A0AA51REJ9_9BACT|nr:ABC transporter substrate-binding protein [Marivirga sp. BDSF4-3]WMN12614.1 ABC transporter substrate-binding protein [Marivirga sp. BDSF4-3]